MKTAAATAPKAMAADPPTLEPAPAYLEPVGVAALVPEGVSEPDWVALGVWLAAHDEARVLDLLDLL